MIVLRLRRIPTHDDVGPRYPTRMQPGVVGSSDLKGHGVVLSAAPPEIDRVAIDLGYGSGPSWRFLRPSSALLLLSIASARRERQPFSGNRLNLFKRTGLLGKEHEVEQVITRVFGRFNQRRQALARVRRLV